MKRQVLMMLSCGLLLVAASPTWARTWTDNTGKYSVEAELVSSQGGQVTLRKPDGSVVVLPITRLSEADRRYLESLQKPTPKESTADVGAEQPSEPAMSGPKLSGKIHGQDFSPDRAELNGGILTLRQGKDFFPDLEVEVFLNEPPEGKTYNVTAKRRFGVSSPQIHMQWKKPGKKHPETEFFSDGYVMKLEFGRASRGKLPGKIDLRLPDKARSVVKGTFTIVMPGETSEPGTGEISGKITLPASSKGMDIHAGCLGRNPEGKLEGPATGFKLEGSSTSASCTTWKPRNSILSWDQKTKSLTHKHVNRPPGWYLVYVRGNRRDLPEGGFSHEGYYDWKWVEIKEDQPKVTVDLTIDPGNSGTVEVTLSGASKESWVTYLPLDENGQSPFPDAHSYRQRTSSAKIEGGKAVIRGLREGKYQVAMGPWQGDTRLPSVTADVEVKRGSTTKVVLTPIPKPVKSVDLMQSPRSLVRELDASSAHSGFIKSIAFSPDGETLASASNDPTITLWNVDKGLPRTTLKGHTGWVLSVAFSPDGNTVASGSRDQTVKLWDVGTGRTLATLKGHTKPVYSVAFSPDGKKVASGGGDTIRIWDVRSRQQRAAFGQNTLSLAFSPDGKKLASSGYKAITIWDVATGRQLAGATPHEHHVFAVAFSPDGKTLASASYDRTVRLSDAATLADRAVLREHLDQVFSVSFSPNGEMLASSGGKTVRLWNPETGQQQAVLQGHTSWVRSVAFSPDGKTLASAGRDRKIKFWDVNTAWKSTP